MSVENYELTCCITHYPRRNHYRKTAPLTSYRH
eukprot:COSAG01_NODE_65276_length_273_cov_10.005747_1_plen_32_part_01